METRTIDVHENQINFAELLSLVTSGTEVVFTEGDTPLARLIPVERKEKSRIAGLHAGAIQTTADFDEPLPEDFWAGTQ
ncbi:MAG TPA: toxin-antitoxin (TA) system antitoxin [Blastocatellia bacterium]|nr:toxin-antitoxin (TA) system antitoxin [Blastocatellia bacterium]